MQKKNTVIINQLSEDRADTVGFCRYLNNDKVRVEDLVKEQTDTLEILTAGKHVLVINDTSELNYENHVNFLNKADKELGPTGNNTDIGFFVHPGLVVDTTTGISLGFSYIKLWNRQWDKKDKDERNYHKQPIETKESYRWIECGLKSKETLPLAEMITIVADRESDIYEEFAIVPDKRTHFLIRSRCDRDLEEGDTLYTRLNATPSSEEYNLKIKTTKKRKGRNASMEIKHTKVRIRRPDHLKKTQLPDYVELNVVEAKEISKNVPEGETPIRWIILTTHAITNFQAALQIIYWYSMHWQIELLCNTMKSGGLNIELSELEKGKALKKICVLALSAALRINQLRQARNDKTGISAQITFTDEQVELLKILTHQYEGSTEKQKNPHKPETLAWAAWVIARMGGWKGYTCESPPGNKTFKWGLDRFDSAFEGFIVAKKMCA